MQVGTKFPLLPLHSVIWEMLHLLVAIVLHGNREDSPCVINAWHGRAHAAKSVSGSAMFIVNLGSHSLVSEECNHAKVVHDSVLHARVQEFGIAAGQTRHWFRV